VYLAQWSGQLDIVPLKGSPQLKNEWVRQNLKNPVGLWVELAGSQMNLAVSDRLVVIDGIIHLRFIQGLIC
jgi:hypothetical protein